MSCKRTVLIFAVLLCLFAVCLPISARGQAVSTGTVVGQVSDASGAAIVGATVTLTDKATNTPRTTTTNEAGRYIFVNVIPGAYDLAVSKTGFRVTKLTDQTVTIGLTLTLDVKLEVGSISQTVEVTSTPGAELQTMNATVGNTVAGIALGSLP